MALSNKQLTFINEYLSCWNASEAARRAGYSAKSARSIGHENLSKPDISAEIQRRVDEITLSYLEVLIRLTEYAKADIGDFLEVSPDGGASLNLAKAQGKTHLIKKVTQRQTVRITANAKTVETVLSLELHDAQAALVLIGKHHRLFTERIEVTGKDGGPVQIEPVKAYVTVTPDDWDGEPIPL